MERPDEFAMFLTRLIDWGPAIGVALLVLAWLERHLALLLFTAGLEFSLTELRRVWRNIVPCGLAQVTLTVIAAGAVVAVVFGGSFTRIAVVGLFVALSSTACSPAYGRTRIGACGVPLSLLVNAPR